MPNKKKTDNEKQDSFIRFGVTEGQKKKIESYAKDFNKSLSDFIRDAIFDKIRRFEHPEQFYQGNMNQMNPAILEQLTLNTKKILELQEQTNQRIKIAEDIENTRLLIKQEYEKLREKGLIDDFSKEADIIIDLLKGHKSLTPEQIEKMTKKEINDEKATLILQIDNRFKLNVVTGRYELR